MQTENETATQSPNSPTAEPKSDNLLTVETIEAAVRKGAKSLTEVAHFLGKKGTISGKLAKEIKELVPGIVTLLKGNAEIAKLPTPPVSKASAKATKPTTKGTKPAPKSKGGGKYRRHPANPFRQGSSYGLAFDILASHKDGIARSDLTKEYAKASRKPLKKASFDIAVLLSPKSEKPTSERHRSCREGFGIRKENSHITLTLP